MKSMERLLEDARRWARFATPEQKAEMHRLQQESWVRGMAPCEHGDPDWETCSDCLSALGQ